MEINPKKIDSGEMESREKLEGGNMKKDIKASKNDYYKIEDTRKSVNKNETISAPAMPASTPAPKDLGQATTSSSLQSSTDLLSEAWELYKSKIKTFLGIVVIPMLLIFFVGIIFVIGLWGSGMMNQSSPESFFDNTVLLSIFLVLGFIFFILIIIIQIWSQAALIYAIKENEDIGIKKAYQKSKSKIKQFFWVSLLSGFIIMGGFIFFAVPGIIFSIWFAFATLIVITEDLKGMDAILKSREYVRNYWWPVFWRLLFINIVMIGIMLIVSIASMLIPLLADIVSIIVTPLITIYIFLVYNNLRKIKGDFEFRPSAGLKKKFIAVGVLGFIIIPLLLSSVVLISLDSAKNKAMDAARRSDMMQIKIDLIVYHDEQGGYPELLSELDNTGYFKDPKTKEPYEYRQLDDGNDYEVCVQFEEEGRECFFSEDGVYRNPSKYENNFDNDINNRDLERVSDLEFISTMVENYKMKTGSCPLSQTIVRLNENNSVVDEIKSANEDINIPIDSKYPEYYYGYKSSDGETFELTAQFENTADSRCELEIKDNDEICIYRLRN
ncbi:MAG: hypothetical protein KAQ87_02340 [Candidatus Pacebacteria bacterium]|nr:hypothetical protein [Candidatus Paceibacterota bacterium]